MQSGCAILISKLIITSAGVPYVKVHHDILLILEDMFKESKVAEVVPEILSTSYLGPDPAKFALSKAQIYEPNCAKSGTSRTLLVAIAFGCSLVLSIMGLR